MVFQRIAHQILKQTHDLPLVYLYLRERPVGDHSFHVRMVPSGSSMNIAY